MDDILKYARISIPNLWVFLSFIVMTIGMIGSVYLCDNRNQSRKYTVLCLLCEYFFLVLCVTIFCRPGSLDHSCRLIPFVAYIKFFTTDKSYLPLEILEEISMNILFFLPVGVLLGCIDITWRRVICVASSLALVIEILQYVMCKGCCETNDVIHNTLGALLGFLLMRWTINILEKLKICRRKAGE